MEKELDLSVEPLEDLEAPWDWAIFAGGAGIGLGAVGIAATVAT